MKKITLMMLLVAFYLVNIMCMGTIKCCDRTISLTSSHLPSLYERQRDDMIDLQDYNGNSALHRAAQKDDLPRFVELLRNGANYELPNKIGLRPIDCIWWSLIHKEMKQHLQLSLCHALKNDDCSGVKRLTGLIEFYSYRSYVIGDVSIMSWAQKFCSDRLATLIFKQVLSDRLCLADIKRTKQLLAEGASVITPGLRSKKAPLEWVQKNSKNREKLELLREHQREHQ
jgi:hypothetical protein